MPRANRWRTWFLKPDIDSVPRTLDIASPAGARLISAHDTGNPRLVVLVLHGGPEHGTSRCRWWMPQVLRCRMLAGAIVRRWPPKQAGAVAVYRLQHAWTGWDGDGRDAFTDIRWGLAELVARHNVSVALCGHSMGGRVAARLADEPGVVGVVGLAPWLPATDPVAQLAGKPLCAIHGSRDRDVTPASTLTFLHNAAAAGALVRQHRIRGSGHGMLFRAGRWHRLATRELTLISDQLN